VGKGGIVQRKMEHFTIHHSQKIRVRTFTFGCNNVSGLQQMGVKSIEQTDYQDLVSSISSTFEQGRQLAGRAINSPNFSEEAYQVWVRDIYSTIETARLKTSLKVNSDLLQLYFTIGKEILMKQEIHGWGAQIIHLLSADLQNRFKSDSGYSSRNLGYMKSFAKEYPDFPILQVPLAELENDKKQSILQVRLAKLDEANATVQVPLVQIPWYHHISLISKVKNPTERAFYILKTAENGWSRDIMLLQVENNLYVNQGKTINTMKSNQ